MKKDSKYKRLKDFERKRVAVVYKNMAENRIAGFVTYVGKVDMKMGSMGTEITILNRNIIRVESTKGEVLWAR